MAVQGQGHDIIKVTETTDGIPIQTITIPKDIMMMTDILTEVVAELGVNLLKLKGQPLRGQCHDDTEMMIMNLRVIMITGGIIVEIGLILDLTKVKGQALKGQGRGHRAVVGDVDDRELYVLNYFIGRSNGCDLAFKFYISMLSVLIM